MPTVAPIQNNFTGGEFSPLVHGRSDVDRYKTGCKKVENFLPTIQGSLVRRPATRFVVKVKDSTKATRLVKFQFSTTQAYALEFGHEYIRFCKDHGQIESAPNVPYELLAPYQEVDLFQLKFTQSVDVLYITHPSYPMAKLSRYADTNWVLEWPLILKDGPYLGTGILDHAKGFVPSPTAVVSFTSSAATGATTLNGQFVDGAAYIPVTTITNNGAGLIRLTFTGASTFTSGDQVWVNLSGAALADGMWRVTVIGAGIIDLQGSVYVAGGTAQMYPLFFNISDLGRLIRIKTAGGWGSVLITGWVSPNVVTGIVQKTIPAGATAALNFRYGVYKTGNYPACSTFHEDRLCLSGAPLNPQRVDMSTSGEYENFAPSDVAGVIAANNAISVNINSTDVNAVKWIATDEKGLLVGTDSSEWAIKPNASTEALSPTNVSAKRASNFGSANIEPTLAGKSILYLQKSSRRIRELIYFYDVDGFRANDLSILSEHLLATGIKQMAYQKEPHSLLWCVRNDGSLAVMTYDRDLESVKAAWSKQIIGGWYNAAKTIRAKVESVCVIAAPDGLSEEPWFVINRRINGVNVRYIEYGSKFFEEEDAQKDAYFLDGGLTYTGAPATNISGLDHLEGETVQIVADGSLQTDKVITAGAITLDAAASTVHIGHHYNSDLQLLRFDAGSANGTAIGKVRRTHLVGLMLHRTLNLMMGMSFDNLLRIIFRADPDLTNAPTPLFTGIKSEEIEANNDMDNMICIRQDQPFPMTILAIMPQMKTQDNI
jgi:hypothetical protein